MQNLEPTIMHLKFIVILSLVFMTIIFIMTCRDSYKVTKLIKEIIIQLTKGEKK